MEIKIDRTKCTGCKLCQLICALKRFKENNPKKAAILVDARFPTPGIFEPRVCTQCGKCAEVCPEEAISASEGVYIIDTEKCTMCKLCVEECPIDVMVVHKEVPFPIKCDLCWECVEVCPTGALVAKKQPAMA